MTSYIFCRKPFVTASGNWEPQRYFVYDVIYSATGILFWHCANPFSTHRKFGLVNYIIFSRLIWFHTSFGFTWLRHPHHCFTARPEKFPNKSPDKHLLSTKSWITTSQTGLYRATFCYTWNIPYHLKAGQHEMIQFCSSEEYSLNLLIRIPIARNERLLNFCLYL